MRIEHKQSSGRVQAECGRAWMRHGRNADRTQTELGQGQVERGRAQAERLPASALIFWFRGVFFLFHVGRGPPADAQPKA